jgi:RNA polymerase sigma-70 factor, ECF subfamily
VALTEIDRKLLKRCLSEEPGAWRDFVDRFIGLFVHVINHTAHSRTVQVSLHDVDDLCGEIFLEILKDNYAVLRRFKGNCSLATYLTVISRRIAVRGIARRRIAAELGHVNAHQVSLHKAKAKQSQSSEQFRIDNQDEVNRLLSDLSENEAEVVRQYHLQGKSYREISNNLGIPENSIGPTLSRAREILKRKRQLRKSSL